MRPDPDSIAQRVNREVVLLAGWAPALLLQLAHPMVARAVADHSDLLRHRRDGWRRLRRTVDAMLALTFGTPEEAERAAAGINAIHRRVHGHLPEGHGAFPAGTPYTATDPELLRWVHATFVDSVLRAHELYIRPLTTAEHDRYCLEATRVEPLLGIPIGYLPRSRPELEAYIGWMLGSGAIAVTDTARAIAREVLHPPLVPVLRPLAALVRVPVAGLLPPAVRQAYGLRWDARRARAVRLAAAVVRAVLPRLPERVRYWPAARNRDHGP
jgi:uncharacterized protein (DUF2236 family)